MGRIGDTAHPAPDSWLWWNSDDVDRPTRDLILGLEAPQFWDTPYYGLPSWLRRRVDRWFDGLKSRQGEDS